MTLEMEQEERKITYMSAGRGHGPHQVRSYSSRPPSSDKEGNSALLRPTLVTSFERCPLTTRSRSYIQLLFWHTGIRERTRARTQLKLLNFAKLIKFYLQYSLIIADNFPDTESNVSVTEYFQKWF